MDNEGAIGRFVFFFFPHRDASWYEPSRGSVFVLMPSKRLCFYKREMGGNPERMYRASRSVHLVIVLLAAARLAVLVQQRRRLALLLDAL